MEPTGTVVFATVGVLDFGFDVFSVKLPSTPDALTAANITERRHTDGVSVNFNAQFVDEGETVAFVSERAGSARFFLSRSETDPAEPLPAVEESLFHDRPILKNGLLYFVSAHEKASEPLKSWAAVYSTRLARNEPVTRITPTGTADFSPAVSKLGELIAVASYGSRPWGGDFRVLETEVTVFRAADPSRRLIAAARGGWPSWRGDSALFFHRVADDGWWSVFQVDLDVSPGRLAVAGGERRVTPPGVHCFTPAASSGRWIAVATRRKGRAQRHIELFDLETERFFPVTELQNPGLHHYNPFFSPESGYLGYHRFRGESASGDLLAPHLQLVRSPARGLRMLRVHGTFPSFSPSGDLIAMNGDFLGSPGLMIVRSDGSKRWTLVKDPMVFYTAWSPADRGVIFTSVGPIFESTKATVRIARVTFDLSALTDDRDEISADIKILTRPDAGNDAFPSPSPCGKWVVFRSGRTGHKNLSIVDAVHGEDSGSDRDSGIRRLTEGAWIDTMPSWSPNGEWIAFSSNRHDPSNPNVFSIYLIRPDGSDLRRVYVAGPAGSAEVDKERINHVCFSPDSKWLLFTANLGGVMAEPVSGPNQFQPYGDLYVCLLDGTGLIRLTCNAYENGTPAWGPRGTALEDLGSLTLGPPVGEKMMGQFDEPLWLTCDV